MKRHSTCASNHSHFVASLFFSLALVGCRSFNSSEVKSDLGSEYLPKGWFKVGSNDDGSFASFSTGAQSLMYGYTESTSSSGSSSSNSGLAMNLHDQSVDGSLPGSTNSTSVPAAAGQAQYTNSYKITKTESTVVKVGGRLFVVAGETQPVNLTMTKEYTVRIWAYADNPNAPLWQVDEKTNEGYLSLANRDWASYQCGVVIRLVSDDMDSIEGAGGLDINLGGVLKVEGGTKKNGTKTNTEENIFARTGDSVVIKATDLKGSTRGPSNSEIQKACETFAKDPTIQASINTDIAIKAKSWRYANADSVCIEDKDCTEWHDGMLPTVANWTKGRCIQVAKSKDKKAYYACRLRSIVDGDCTPPGSGRGPFEYPCDKGLTCTPYTKGALWWKQTLGTCKETPK